jgi:hypothetical protein
LFLPPTLIPRRSTRYLVDLARFVAIPKSYHERDVAAEPVERTRHDIRAVPPSTHEQVRTLARDAAAARSGGALADRRRWDSARGRRRAVHAGGDDERRLSA